MNEHEKIRYLFKGIIPADNPFWYWLDNKWLKYGGVPDYDDMRALKESIGYALSQDY